MSEETTENSSDSSKVTVTLQLEVDVVNFFTEQSKENGREIQDCISDLLQMYRTGLTSLTSLKPKFILKKH